MSANQGSRKQKKTKRDYLGRLEYNMIGQPVPFFMEMFIEEDNFHCLVTTQAKQQEFNNFNKILLKVYF